MIFSEQSIFSFKQSIPLANDTASHNVDSTNTIDLGPGLKPFRVRNNLPRDIGQGDPIPIQGMIDSISPNLTTSFRLILMASHDNTTFVEVQTTFLLTKAGDQLRFKEVPRGTRRYLKFVYRYQSTTAPGANKTAVITSGLGTVSGTQGVIA
ncbi:hypothetical protein BJAS_P3449 [Bathymodiolus japonicus methanotrophic gill symbiont]|uniref:hypothetical protein n=1 Tax=Bathymodiolus japonicus methanotrophic gill symbiont TaxID=113269 RepID=UPI001B566A82|nr:hypothetical protein [Bathymodiolus japonicus methanotrophic gill symbiont]GFO72912.1 hypothetical protein BJAS_P3449 [Bathymodiolus japonicus methanotrophic gill symbiont]